MFQPKVIKVLSYIALVCCSIGMILSAFALSVYHNFIMYMGIGIWILLLYSSYLGIKLSTYDLYDEDRKKLAIYILCILVVFILFMCVGFIISVLPALFLAIKLHNQKSGFDTWMKEQKEL
jgi:hypothetical protein